MKLTLFVFMALAISTLLYAEDLNTTLCQEKPWLCEDLPCPENEEIINNICHCKPGFTRDKETNTCKGLLD